MGLARRARGDASGRDGGLSSDVSEDEYFKVATAVETEGSSFDESEGEYFKVVTEFAAKR